MRIQHRHLTMTANTNAVTLSVVLLSLLFLLSNAVDVDPTSVTATQIMDEITAVDSESTAVVSTTSEEEGNTVDRIVFHPAVESISAVNPDLIAHSFRIPFHRLAGRSRCRHGHADGFLRLSTGHAHRHFHRGEGFGLDPDHKRMQEKNQMEEKESTGADGSKKEFDEEELQHKRKKMMRKENKDDEKMEEFEHKRKKMRKRMRFNNGEAEEFEKDDSDEKEEGKKFGHKRMRRFRKETVEGGFMDRVHHFFNGFF